MRKTYGNEFIRFLVMYVRNEKNYVYKVKIDSQILFVYYGNKQIHAFWLSDKDMQIVKKAKKNAKKIRT